MSTHFHAEDLGDDLPQPGDYLCTITRADLRQSASGNPMVLVVHTLDDVPPGRDRVPDYFVLANANPAAARFARRRLVQLFRACRIEPRPGEEIRPDLLLHARLTVRVDHDTWNDQLRLRAVAYFAADRDDAPPL